MTGDAALIARLRDPVYAHKRKDELEAADRIAALTQQVASMGKDGDTMAADFLRERARAAKAEAERDALRAVYNAALAWRDSDVEEDDQALEAALVAAIDAARREPKPERECDLSVDDAEFGMSEHCREPKP